MKNRRNSIFYLNYPPRSCPIATANSAATARFQERIHELLQRGRFERLEDSVAKDLIKIIPVIAYGLSTTAHACYKLHILIGRPSFQKHNVHHSIAWHY